MPKLIVTLPNRSEQSHDLTEKVTTIGRSPDNVLQIDDASISGYHARISLIDKHYELEDIGSTNGTRVNGETFKKWELTHGDEIQFGTVPVRYVTEVQTQSVPMPAATTAALKPAESSRRPSNFSNASPFKTKKTKKDSLTLAARALMVLAFLAFLGSVFYIYQIQPPQ